MTDRPASWRMPSPKQMEKMAAAAAVGRNVPQAGAVGPCDEMPDAYWQDVYAFLTTEPNAEVGAIHPKAMPVILTTPEEVETWMTASPEEALKLQRPLPDGALRIVARGVKEDEPTSADSDTRTHGA